METLKIPRKEQLDSPPMIYSIKLFIFRSEWELFDRKEDPFELTNVANKPRYSKVHKEQNFNFKIVTFIIVL